MTWSSNTIYVDIDTGEKLTVKKNKTFESYIVIKTTKNVNINYQQGQGHITYIKQCRRNPQQAIDFGK